MPVIITLNAVPDDVLITGIHCNNNNNNIHLLCRRFHPDLYKCAVRLIKEYVRAIYALYMYACMHVCVCMYKFNLVLLKAFHRLIEKDGF